MVILFGKLVCTTPTKWADESDFFRAVIFVKKPVIFRKRMLLFTRKQHNLSLIKVNVSVRIPSYITVSGKNELYPVAWRNLKIYVQMSRSLLLYFVFVL
jgi:hypothetical protein